MAKHTQLEYGKLLKEQLEKQGMRVGLLMEEGERGWQGSLILARGEVHGEGSKTYIAELHSDVHIYVYEDGEVRVYYSEPIIIDIEQKARWDAYQQELKRQEEALCHSEKYFYFEEDDICFEEEDVSDISLMESYAEVQSEADESTTYEDAAENLEYISEKRELEILRTLNNQSFALELYNRKNENRLTYHGRYHMEACSRNSAKRAAIYICDELFAACSLIKYLSEQLNFVRVKPQKKWESWVDAEIVGEILDDFSQISSYLEAKKKARRKEELSRTIEEKEQLSTWMLEKMYERYGEDGVKKAEALMESMRQEIAKMQAELDGLNDGKGCDE